MGKLRFAAILAALILLFVAGCSDSGDGSGSSGKLPAVPSATGGKITEGNYSQMANSPVTEANKVEFLNALASAMSGEDYYYSSEEKATRSKLAGKNFWKKRKATRATDSGTDTIDGLHGYMTIDYKITETENETRTGYDFILKGTATQRAFDFSEDGNLFIGGALGMAVYMREYESINAYEETYEVKANGTLQFRGAFSGSIGYKNLYLKESYSGKIDSQGYEYDEKEDEKITGEIVITSYGKEIKLNAEELEYLAWGLF